MNKVVEYALWGTIPGGNLIQAGIEGSNKLQDDKRSREAEYQAGLDKAEAKRSMAVSKAAKAAASAAEKDAKAQSVAAAAAEKAAAAQEKSDASTAELAKIQAEIDTESDRVSAAAFSAKLESAKPFLIGGLLLAAVTGALFMFRR